MLNSKLIDLIKTYGASEVEKEFLNALYECQPDEWETNFEEIKDIVTYYSTFPSEKDVGKYFKSGNKYFKVLKKKDEDGCPTLLYFVDDVDGFFGIRAYHIGKALLKELNDEGIQEITELAFHIAYDKVFKYIPNL